MSIFTKKESNMINETYITTVHSRNLIGKNKLLSVSFNELTFNVVDTREYQLETKKDTEYGTLLKCGSKFILFNGIDMSDSSFGDMLRRLEHFKSVCYVMESLIKYENIVVIFEECETEESNNELRYIICKFKEKNITHLETIELVRSMIDNSIGKRELPDFPYLEIINGKVSRLLRLTK